MASITCTNCGATLKTANPIAAGKKVKCPKCKELFVVEDEEENEEEPAEDEDTGAEDEGDEEEEEAPKPRKPAKASDDEEESEDEDEEEEAPKSKKPTKASKDDDEDEEEDEEEEEEAPKKKGKPDPKAKKKGKGKDDDEDEEDEDDDEKPKKKSSMMLIIIIVVVLLFCCIGCSTVSWIFQATLKGLVGMGEAAAKKLDDGAKMKQEPGGQKRPDLTPEFKKTSVELATEFIKDEKAAAAKYKDKVFEITGEVVTVGPTVDQVMLKGVKRKPTDGSEFGVRLGVPPDQQPKATCFSKGQKVKAVGKYFSFQEAILGQGGWVTITDCTITELEPTKIIVTTAVDFAKEFEQNAKTAEAKYKNQDAIITGTVEDIRQAKDGGKLAVLKGTGKTRVVFPLGGFGQPEVLKGHTVEFRAATESLLFNNNEVEIFARFVLSSK